MLPYPTSSLQRVPDEILSYIFLFTTQCNEYHYDSLIMPLTISHICSRWRNVALGTGRLWSDVVITTFSSTVIHRLHTWLTRSKKCPLDILIDFRDDEWDWEEDNHWFTSNHMKILLDLLIPHVQRWGSFNLITDTWEPIHRFLSLTNTVIGAPMLRSLMLSRCNAYFAGNGQVFLPVALKEPIPLLGGIALPNLRDISFIGVHVDWAHSSLRNLRKLEFKFHAYEVMPSLREFIDILTACSNLEKLSILGWGPRFNEYARTFESPDTKHRLSFSKVNSTIVLSKLVELTFGFVNAYYGLKLLSLFDLPGLKEFDLEDVSVSADPLGLGPGDASIILDWLSSADSTVDAPDPSKASNGVSRGCTLPLLNVERLGLSGVYSSESTFFRFLRAFPAVKKICLSDTDPNLLLALDPQNPPPAEGTLVEPILEDSCQRLRRRSSVSLASARSRVAPCPQLVDIICRRIDYNKLSGLVARRAMGDSGVQPVQMVRIEHTPPLVDDDDEYDTSFEDSFSSSGLSEADRQIFEESGVELLITNRNGTC